MRLIPSHIGDNNLLHPMIQFFQKKPVAPYISKAISDDIPQLSSIHAQGFSRGWGKNELAQMLDAQGIMCLVLREVGNIDRPPMGFVLCRRAGDEAEIITISTEPKNRGRGVARSLMDEIIRNLQADRVKSLLLEVDETNVDALELYQSLGFYQAGERKGYYPASSGSEAASTNALVMRLDFE